MEVKVFKLKEIKLLSGDVVDVEQYCNVQPILPTYGKEGDACMDVYPILCEHDVDKDRFIYHTGLAFNIGDDANGEPNEMSLRPRSNLTNLIFICQMRLVLLIGVIVENFLLLRIVLLEI